MLGILLGCIADDFTGATDLAGILVNGGMRTLVTIGVPDRDIPADVDAVVIALKSRTTPPDEAIADSLGALDYLRRQGTRQYYFKYCSTFDSTDRGNIGPVAEALMGALSAPFTIACPAFPANARTIYKGYLFVGDVLLNESGMRNHPLTPMTDANLVRVLARQSTRPVGLVEYATVAQGAAAITERFAALQAKGDYCAIVDALSNDDLMALGEACRDMVLLTGGSGAALGLPANFVRAGLLTLTGAADRLPPSDGARAVLAGSCSTATQAQVAKMRATHPAFEIDPVALAAGEDIVGAALEWATPKLGQEPILISSTASPDAVRAAQARYGAEHLGGLIEGTLANIARGLVEREVGQLIVAGGETSGAVTKALGVQGLRIGPQIDPGVPWTQADRGAGNRPLALALKSGNFGTEDFFLKAWDLLA